jgi:hypothetical protein
MLVLSPPALAIISILTLFAESTGKTACSLASRGAKRLKRRACYAAKIHVESARD